MRLPVQLLKRRLNTHKGNYGYVFILGGSPGLTGAVCLSAQAALRTGAGLVTVGIPESLNQIFEIKLTEVMSLPLAEERGVLCSVAFKKVKQIADKVDVIVLGPGASRAPATKKVLLKVIKEIDKPMVIDADGINALALDIKLLEKRKSRNLVLTPHLLEFSRLTGLEIRDIKKSRKELVRQFALKYNLTLVLKGNRTLVSGARKAFENTTGNPGMATAGMGDVLAGIIAGLMAQGLGCFEAAKYGVYLHGLAADFAVKDKTQSCLIASDAIDYLPKAFKSSMK